MSRRPNKEGMWQEKKSELFAGDGGLFVCERDCISIHVNTYKDNY